MSDPVYGPLDRFLHRLALGSRSVAQMSFELNQNVVHDDPESVVSGKHVFVAGLARAGTTVLMRRFHATNEYRSLTYRDMPFVLAPNLWQRLTAASKREIATAERAHGDGVLVDLDSPESFEEVFWRVFSGDEYLQADKLTPHAPDEETVADFVRYVNAILATNSSRADRYLSKNNNSILRLGTIRRAFPQSLILIPFRDPLQQAQSLLRQHSRFIEIQKSDHFTLSYMTWLGHHEFGQGHRPFVFDDTASSSYAPTTLNYWLHLWCETYAWLLGASNSGSGLFICYEDLCADETCWQRLAALAALSDKLDNGEPFELRNSTVSGEVDPALSDRAEGIYDRLTRKGRAQLS